MKIGNKLNKILELDLFFDESGISLEKQITDDVFNYIYATTNAEQLRILTRDNMYYPLQFELKETYASDYS